jgi:outer membrane protein TolC
MQAGRTMADAIELLRAALSEARLELARIEGELRGVETALKLIVEHGKTEKRDDPR